MKKAIILLTIIFLLIGCTSTYKYTNEDIEDLNQQAAELDGTLNVSARKYYDIYIKLGTAYYQMEEYELSLIALKKGLRLNARDYESQLLAARVENNLEMYEESYKRVRQIINNCENEEITKKAVRLSNGLQKHEIVLQEKEIPDVGFKYIYILQLGQIDEIYIQALSNKLEEEFKISVIIMETQLKPSEENLRDNHNAYYKNVKDRFIESNGQVIYEEIILKLNLDKEVLSKDIINNEFVYSLYLMEDGGEELWTENMAKIQDQYDASEILNQIRREYRDKIDETDCFGILAVTSYDIYANDYNYLFGWNGSDVAIMSYNRFINEETATTNEIKRIVMQGMSSTGFLIGIPRCTVDTCARAYPHSLAEHDQKDDTLCDECTDNLIRIYDDL